MKSCLMTMLIPAQKDVTNAYLRAMVPGVAYLMCSEFSELELEVLNAGCVNLGPDSRCHTHLALIPGPICVYSKVIDTSTNVAQGLFFCHVV